MSETKSYAVTWEISLDAESPEHAAKLARDIQLDPDSGASFFEVREEGTDMTKFVDVEEC